MKWLVLIAGLLTVGYLVNKSIDQHAAREALPHQQRQQLEANERNEHAASGVRVFHDDERKVTCWKYEQYNRGGLSCLPDNQIRLAD